MKYIKRFSLCPLCLCEGWGFLLVFGFWFLAIYINCKNLALTEAQRTQRKASFLLGSHREEAVFDSFYPLC